MALVASDAAQGDNFGSVVAISGTTAVVGSPNCNLPAGADVGCAYVFITTDTSWTQQAKLTAAGAGSGHAFGWSVAIAGDTIAVGAPSANSAYVFVRIGSAWAQQAKLVPSDPQTGLKFGASIAVSGDTVVVGAPGADLAAASDAGAAYVFGRSGAVWTQAAKLVAGPSAAGAAFGTGVAIDVDTIAVGAPLDGVTDAGQAYVFRRAGASWPQEARLMASGAAAGGKLGQSIAVSGNTVLAGAHLHNPGGKAGAGAAYAFVRSGTSWTQQAKLVPLDSAAGYYFGWSVALRGDAAIVGSLLHESAGSAYGFARSAATWTQQSRFVAPERATYDYFGFSVSIDASRTLVGAPLRDLAAGADAGSAYAFELTPPETTIDSGPSGVVPVNHAFFSYSSDQTGGFQCALDAAPFATCTATAGYTGLADGTHTFRVRAVGPSGLVDPTPATRTWTVDTAPPTVEFTTADGATLVFLPTARQDRVTGVASDAVGIASVFVSYAPITPGAPFHGETAGLACTGGSCTFSARPPPFPGQYSVTAWATDQAGHMGGSEAISVTVVRAL